MNEKQRRHQTRRSVGMEMSFLLWAFLCSLAVSAVAMWIFGG